MSLYDDLGVRQGATPEEVREHYRVLVRLFHPDQFSDPVLKAAAEGQMRRFNEIAGILTDPEKLRAHETEALPPIYIQAPQAETPARRVPWNSLAWGTAAMACAGAIVWVSGHDAVPDPPALKIATLAPEAPQARAAGSRVRSRRMHAARDESAQELSPLPEIAEETEPGSSADPEPASPPAPAMEEAAEKPAMPKSFSGIWFYAKRPGTPGRLYAPEFIETHITEHDGQVRGRYRSRYRVTDMAVSPLVNFEFTGHAEGPSAQMSLTRDDGARGEVHLRLISEDELELVWTADGAPSPSLTSGTAILLRGQ